MNIRPFHIDKDVARRAFERSAYSYDSAADLQRKIGEQLLTHLNQVRIVPRVILDLGCGTGQTALLLAEHVKQVIAVDNSAAIA